MPTVYKRCGKSLNVNEISEGRHAAVRLVYNEVILSCTSLVAITGDMSDENQSKMHSAGFDMVLPKPVKFSDLTRAVTAFAPTEQ